MKFHIITIGQPKLGYAKLGWEEYWKRLGHYHQIRSTHIPDRSNNAKNILETTKDSYIIALDSTGEQFSSPELAKFLEKRELEAREVSFIIGGPEGLPIGVTNKASTKWSLGKLTYPHDLAMVILLEALYRASTINAGLPYHK